MITHPMRRFLTVALLCLLAHPLIASGFITIDSQPIDISALPLGQSKEVLVFAGGPNCGFVKMTSSFYGEVSPSTPQAASASPSKRATTARKTTPTPSRSPTTQTGATPC